ncbi:MAG TPA: GDYXXLXY domain-containing protein [Nocardioides sp.]|nr:GDYXXLXY domain-containing protein [Nocardioides sp.]
MTTLETGIRPDPVDPTPRSPRTGHLARVVAAVLASLALVGVAVWPQLSARLTGEEVVLRVQPVDPIDPFRGAYVDLDYPDLPSQPLAETDPPTEQEQEAYDDARGTVYVPLTRQGEVWVGGEARRTAPSEGLYLTCDDSSWRLRCGIESWFLPQSEAKALEDAVRDGRAIATVRVDDSGNAALIDVSTR